ncbi:MAG: hypothetical protein ACXWQO_14585 [Bdellovibrionota bacterium]
MRTLFLTAAALASSLAQAATPMPTLSIGDSFVPVADMTISNDHYFRNGKRGNGSIDEGAYCRISPEQYAQAVKIKAGDKLIITQLRGSYFIPRGGDGLESDVYLEMQRGPGRWEIMVYCARPKTGTGSDADWTLEEIQQHLGPLFTFQLNLIPNKPIPGKSPMELFGSKIKFNENFSATGYKKIRFQGGELVNEFDPAKPACFIDSADGFSGFAVHAGEELTIAKIFGGYFSHAESRPVATPYMSNFRFTAQSAPKFQLVCNPPASSRKVGLAEIQEAMGKFLTVL